MQLRGETILQALVRERKNLGDVPERGKTRQNMVKEKGNCYPDKYPNTEFKCSIQEKKYSKLWSEGENIPRHGREESFLRCSRGRERIHHKGSPREKNECTVTKTYYIQTLHFLLKEPEREYLQRQKIQTLCGPRGNLSERFSL